MIINFYYQGEVIGKRTGEMIPANGETVIIKCRKTVGFNETKMVENKYKVIDRVWDISADPMWVSVYLESA